MSIPFFYIEQYEPAQKEIVLDEDTSRHIIQVLRMKPGELIHLTDGKGALISALITDAHKKHCTVIPQEMRWQAPPAKKISIGISLLKNANRFEWFLEKATEIGVSEIIPLLCKRTEKEKFRRDRLSGILTSAMLQSEQCWLPVLHEPIAYELLFRQEEIAAIPQKFIAHCVDGQKQELSPDLVASLKHQLMLIGPEGDFSETEIEMALANQCIPVSLGPTRLRTETAGIVAVTRLLSPYPSKHSST